MASFSVSSAGDNSEDRYRQLFNDLPLGIFRTSVGGDILETNPSCLRLFGFASMEEARSRHESSLYANPAHRQRMLETLLTRGSVSRWRVRLRRADGTFFWGEVYSTLVRDEEGTPRFVDSILLDVTEHLQAEETTTAELEKVRTYLDAAGVLLLVIDADQKVSLINKKACQILGYNEDEIVGRNWFDTFLPERTRKEAKAVFAALMHGKMAQTEPFENPVLTKGGEERIIAWRSVLLRNREGKPYATLGSGEDVTEAARIARRQQAISDVSRQIAELRPGQRMEGTLRTLQAHLPFSFGAISSRGIGHIVQWPADWPKAAVLSEALRLASAPDAISSLNDLIGTVATVRAPIVQNDTRQSTYEGDRVLAQHGIYSVVTHPLVLRDELQIVLILFSEEAQAFTDERLELLEQVAPLLASGAESHLHWSEIQRLNMTLEKRVEDRTAEIRALYDLSLQLGYTLRHEEPFAPVCEYLLSVSGADVVAMTLWGQGLQLPCEMFVRARRPLSPSIAPVLMTDVCEVIGSSLPAEEPPLAERYEMRIVVDAQGAPSIEQVAATIVEPMEIQGECLGGLILASQQENAFTEDHRRLLRAVAVLASNSFQRLRALAQAETSRLQEALDAMREAVILLDREDRIVAANPAAQQLLPRLAEVDAESGEFIHSLGGFTLSALRERALSAGPAEVTITDDHRLVVEISAVPYTTPDGQTGTVLTLHDITDLRESQVRMEQQARLAALGQLAGGIAHDFNNILTTVIGLAQLGLADPDVVPQLRSDLEQISQQGQRAARLVRQMMDFGRRSMSRKTPLRLGTFLAEATQFLQRTLPENISIQTDIAPGTYLVNADAALLQQMVANLAANAQEAMPGGGTLTLRLTGVTADASLINRYPMMMPGRYARLTMEDTGRGMPPKVLARAFEPFFTTKGIGEGSGLGLAQVYGIVKQHDGYVFLESQVNQGTQAFIYLPILEEKVVPLEGGEAKMPEGQGKTILVAESEEMVLAMAQRLLERIGYRVLRAQTVPAALEVYRLHQQEVAAVVADMTLPKMGGTTLFEELRQLSPALPVILVTSYGEDETIRRLREQGLRWVIHKPFRVHELAGVLQQALEE